MAFENYQSRHLDVGGRRFCSIHIVQDHCHGVLVRPPCDHIRIVYARHNLLFFCYYRRRMKVLRSLVLSLLQTPFYFIFFTKPFNLFVELDATPLRSDACLIFTKGGDYF